MLADDVIIFLPDDPHDVGECPTGAYGWNTAPESA
jgi:hypothetical protein